MERSGFLMLALLQERKRLGELRWAPGDTQRELEKDQAKAGERGEVEGRQS